MYTLNMISRAGCHAIDSGDDYDALIEYALSIAFEEDADIALQTVFQVRDSKTGYTHWMGWFEPVDGADYPALATYDLDDGRKAYYTREGLLASL